MWAAISDFLRRIGHVQTRADELALLHQRLRAAPRPAEASPEEVALARELQERRQAVLDALGEVQSCRGCARGHPLPNGRWDGGHCCGGRTEQLFTDDEVASLRLSGVTSGELRAPRSDHAGCAFRGPTGCSLKAVNRPNICVRYLCRDLMGELAKRGDLRKVLTACMALDATLARFKEARAPRSPSPSPARRARVPR